MLVADRSPTVRRSVSPRKGRESSQCSGDLFVTDRRWGGDRSALSPTSRQSVAKRFPSVRQSIGDVFTNVIDLSAHDSVISQQVLEEVRSTVKMVRKSSRKRDLFAIQGLNQYYIRLLLVNCLYTIMASIATFWFTLAGAATATL